MTDETGRHSVRRKSQSVMVMRVARSINAFGSLSMDTMMSKRWYK